MLCVTEGARLIYTQKGKSMESAPTLKEANSSTFIGSSHSDETSLSSLCTGPDRKLAHYKVTLQSLLKHLQDWPERVLKSRLPPLVIVQSCHIRVSLSQHKIFTPSWAHHCSVGRCSTRTAKPHLPCNWRTEPKSVMLFMHLSVWSILPQRKVRATIHL